MFSKYAISVYMLLVCFTIYGQRGPGGVSNDVPGNSDCKMWCDAGELSLADGASVSAWPDISLSANTNTPTQATAANQPTYRSDLSAGINGNPILRFLPAQYLQLVSSDDINNSGPYTERTTFLAFRTGSDITTRQMLWEQGGTIRGLNIYIYNGELYFGGYDLEADVGDGTPSWGYTYTRVPIAAGTPYVVAHIFDGPAGSRSGSISGYLNGETFARINPGSGNPARGVGSLWTHPDAPGLGAINEDSYNELGPLNDVNGQQPFLGDMAEFIAYDRILNTAERIIVENYLGAKYFANLIEDDYFDYESTHGTEVIGIGRHDGSTQIHNTAQGRNLFQIEGNSAEFGNTNYEYFLIGHDQGNVSAWTTTNAPNNGVSTLRISREWKADHTGDVGDITFTLDINDLPALPAGYAKYCLVVDKRGGGVADFNNDQTEIIEMVNTTGTMYTTTEDIPDGAYLTLAIIDPEIQFTNSTNFGFELTPSGVDNSVAVEVQLNYRPDTDVTVNYSFTDNTATFGAAADYFNIAPSGGFITIAANTYASTISLDIVGDAIAEASEDLTLTLFSGASTTSGLGIGANATNVFTIFDDDNTPKVGFGSVGTAQSEGEGSVNIRIVRSGNTTPAVSVDYRLRVTGGAGTATDGADYSFSAGTANFASGVTTVDMPLTIIENRVDEPDRTVIFELLNPIDSDIDATFKEHTTTIIDNDSPPEVQFTIAKLQGPEITGDPVIEVQLSAASSLIVQIDYEDVMTGTASAASDYTIASTGTLTFAPGEVTATLPLIITNDAEDETDETINFELIVLSAVNCTPAGNLTHEYTIKDYSSFEWNGVAGVGQTVDNVFWLNASALPDADNADVQDFTDSSPNGVTVSQTTAGHMPMMNFEGPNGRKELVFNGTSDLMIIEDDPNINTGSFYIGKHIFINFTTGANVTNRQMIYEQGGGARGISIYIDGGELYYHVWSNNDDNGSNSAWGARSSTGPFYVSSGAGSLTPGTNYTATFEYTVTGNSGLLEGYLNGQSVGSVVTSTPRGVPPRLYAHGDEGGLGGVSGATRYHDNAFNNNLFAGAIQEVIQYSNAPVNTTRRLIVENYLSAKYNVALAPAAQYYSASYATNYGNDVAGIGQFGSSDNHADSQGTGIVRINAPASLDNGDYLFWGHDGVSLTMGTTPPGEIIPGIDNRLARVWKVSERGGDTGAVNVSFNLDALAHYAAFREDDLVLLIDSDDGDFSNSDQIETGKSFNAPAGILTFSGVNFDHDQWFTLGSKAASTLLPIELLEFTAHIVGGRVQLNWSTATETNNDYFTIEKSRDGINWFTLTTINGAGNSDVRLDYEAWDATPYSSLTYYRLKQTDFDGAYSYSSTESVLNDALPTLKIKLHPNPVKDLLSVTGNEDELQTVSIHNALSQDVSYAVRKIAHDATSLVLDLSHLSPGVYMVKSASSSLRVYKD